MKMQARLVEKPWGQRGVAQDPSPGSNRRIGEICFEHPNRQPLPVSIKYLYTSERLSIQVHPDDEQARARGHHCGKDEMWIVLEAAEGATIGLGLKREISPSELRGAMADGSIEELVDWRPVERGDVIYNRAGTIHAAGAGLVLLEIQQSADLTYRLFDYGRERELHVEDGLSVARPGPHRDDKDCKIPSGTSAILADGPHFAVAWCEDELPEVAIARGEQFQLAVTAGEARVGAATVRAGECALAPRVADIALGEGARAVLVWPVANRAAAVLARAA